MFGTFTTLTGVALKIVEALGLIDSEVQKWAKEAAAKYPEGDQAWEFFLDKWVKNASNEIQHDTLVANAREAWVQLWGQRPGYNPNHGMIS